MLQSLLTERCPGQITISISVVLFANQAFMFVKINILNEDFISLFFTLQMSVPVTVILCPITVISSQNYSRITFTELGLNFN